MSGRRGGEAQRGARRRGRRGGLRPLLRVLALCAAAAAACSRDGGAPENAGPAGAGRGAESADAGEPRAVVSEPDIEEVRKARAALLRAGVPIYPGARGLDSTEFEANTAPFITVDFFTTDAPERVAAFYDREVADLTLRRDTVVEPGAVRYEFERDFSGVAVRPWLPAGADSSGFLARLDRRDVQGVTFEQLDAYGSFLREARTHVVVNVPRPEPEVE
ncbi:MAG: hypothetical protein ABR599_08780 [Gemmatimonadota bacterium]